MRNISFYRDFTGYTGGHQKVRDYLEHSLLYQKLCCDLYLTSTCDDSNIFANCEGVNYQQEYRPDQSDFVFLAGLDWKAYLPYFDPLQTKINLIQHLRHADPAHEQFYYLQYYAIRICVSESVRGAIEPYANGPCVHVPMGHHLPEIITDGKKVDIYILAKKRPGVGVKIAEWAEKKGLTFILHDELQTKNTVLQAMASASLSVLLPHKTEGFYLPGIEAAYYSERVLMTNCIANFEYADVSSNITICNYPLADIFSALEKFYAETNVKNAFDKNIRSKEKSTIKQRYSLEHERIQYQKILTNLIEGEGK
ncbi:hypothetical protein [Agaribacter marinus]|uniref:Glycosyl transferases group 1 n=1 Tax=Agaribacter marinus TaxID=1431249 RepID=A0AA37WKF6_9ALTE|nr:hypothetical protein [Agaribacter marinus]GLR70865.1 hypothetical protein GCM10007852_17730 [Agaribacter marinus]